MTPALSGAAAGVLVPRVQEGDDPVGHRSRQPPSNPVCLVLYIDTRYVVVSKPADVRIDGDFTHTVAKFVAAAVARRAAEPGADAEACARNLVRTVPGQMAAAKVRNIHRLDYATSGVMIVALSKAAAGLACGQFESRTVRKSYLALLHGHVAASTVVAYPIAEAPGFLMEVGGGANPGRPARSRLEVLSRGAYRGSPVTKVRLVPETGRRHQLRLHAVAHGHPIVGDATYVPDEGRTYFPDDPEFLPPRMMLHAARLELNLPPKEAVVYGRKSSLGLLRPHSFEAEDPFVSERLAGLELAQLDAAAQSPCGGCES
jgi:tRNA pseudouridine32 synthase / 23S rRNA pseudouridine746 synthase